MTATKSRRNLWVALTFLAPNIVGMLVFVVFPVVFSVMLAFTNWNLRRHNMFSDESIEFVGLANFIRLLTEDDFLRFLGNTLFLMMGIPFSVAGALLAAILLSKDTRGGGGRVFAYLLAAGGLVVSAVLLTAVGLGGTSMMILLLGVAGGILLLGLGGGVTAYRTLFYMPHFTAGVATFLLWKKLYNPYTGPINQALRPVLNGVETVVAALPASLVAGGMWLWLVLAALLAAYGFSRLRRMWRDGELAERAAAMPALVLLAPAGLAASWSAITPWGWALTLAVIAAGLWQAVRVWHAGKNLASPTAMEGFGSGLMLALGLMVAQFVCVGLAATFLALPVMAADGLSPPHWLTDYDWAKPSLMIMGLWAAVGSNNMLLYLAALTNVAPELYEAADIDGASRWQRFWHVTWPQLAPTTFFISVMATIHGLQGGFEMARTMTQGGPAGATTTLSYFIYLEGFETGRLSFASAAAWFLFLLVFCLTMFNWRFGNRYVND